MSIESVDLELGYQASLSLSLSCLFLSSSFFLLTTSFFFFPSFSASPQDTLNNNSFGKKYSWQEKVSGSSSPLKTGELFFPTRSSHCK